MDTNMQETSQPDKPNRQASPSKEDTRQQSAAKSNKSRGKRLQKNKGEATLSQRNGRDSSTSPSKSAMIDTMLSNTNQDGSTPDKNGITIPPNGK